MNEKTTCCLNPEDAETMAAYWNETFRVNEVQNWAEQSPAIGHWINSLSISKDARIFLAGVGDAVLVDFLVDEGFTRIIANDISEEALDRVSRRVQSPHVTYLHDDLINPQKLHELHGSIDLYIDRATLHFFTKCAEKDHYFNQLDLMLTTGGISMIGVFNKNNKAKCCGLDLQLWSLESLKNRLGDYQHLDEFTREFIEQNKNKRNYIYLMSQKTSSGKN